MVYVHHGVQEQLPQVLELHGPAAAEAYACPLGIRQNQSI